MNRLARTAVAVVGLYQDAVSPRRGPSCRFGPTCSSYAIEAVERFGLARGGWLALRRLSKCHPFHAGGYDPVPAAPDIAASTTAAVDDDRHGMHARNVEPNVSNSTTVRRTTVHSLAAAAPAAWKSEPST